MRRGLIRRQMKRDHHAYESAVWFQFATDYPDLNVTHCVEQLLAVLPSK
jgi:hypothetical protein